MQTTEVVRRDWAESLENVLNDYEALTKFKQWMGVDDDSNEHPIRLYFAIKAFCDFSQKLDLRSAPLAREIFIKFLKPRTGFCSFIDLEIREEIGRRVTNLFKSPAKFMPNLFDPCLPDLYKFLRYQHKLFVEFYNLSIAEASSKDFIINNDISTVSKNNSTKFNSIENANTASNSYFNSKSLITPSKTFSPEAYESGFIPNTCTTKKNKKNFSQQQQHQPTPKLTASSLYHSQRDRETTLGQSLVEKLYKPINKHQFTCQPTTSKNDSLFSSDTNRFQHSNSLFYPHHYYHHQQTSSSIKNNFYLNQSNGQDQNSYHLASHTICDEQQKLNSTTNNLKSELYPLLNTSLNSSQFDHSTLEGRIAFNKILTKKLLKIIEMREEEEEVECIPNKQVPKSIREFIIDKRSKINNDPTTSLPFLNVVEDENDDSSLDAVDNDIDNYYRCCMISAGGDSSTFNSQQQTPPISDSTNDDSLFLLQQQNPSLTQNTLKKTTTINNKRLICHKSPELNSNSLQTSVNCGIEESSQNLLQFVNPNFNYVSPTFSLMPNSSMINPFIINNQTSQNHFANVLTNKQLSQRQAPIFNYLNQSPKQLNQHYRSCSPDCQISKTFATDCFSKQNFDVNSTINMSQSCFTCPTTIPKNFSQNSSINKKQQQQNLQRIMGFAPPPGKSGSVSPYKDIYCDNDGDTSGIGTLTYISDASTNSELLKKQRAAVFKKARKLNAANSSGSTDLPSGIVSTTKQDFLNETVNDELICKSKDELQNRLIKSTQNIDGQKITISYRRYGDNSSVPVVANITLNKHLTFKEFRRYLSISSREKNQFFFRTICEDGSAPYQLLLINNDSTILPIFEGKISAEFRSVSDSE